MKLEIEIDLKSITNENPKDGQISVKLPKDQEIRFKQLNIKYEKRLSEEMRKFAMKLMDHVEKAS